MSKLMAFFRTPLGWLVIALLLVWLWQRYRASGSLKTGDNSASIAASITPIVPTGVPSPYE